MAAREALQAKAAAEAEKEAAKAQLAASERRAVGAKGAEAGQQGVMDRLAAMEKLLMSQLAEQGGKIDAVGQQGAKLSAKLDEVLAQTVKLQRLAHETQAQLAATCSVLLRGIFEATEVHIPTGVIICAHRIEDAAFTAPASVDDVSALLAANIADRRPPAGR